MNRITDLTLTSEYTKRLEKLMRPDVVRLRTGMQFGAESKYVSLTIPHRKFKQVELIHITDVQFGHLRCRLHRVKEYRDWILSKPNRFMLWGGDMIDAWVLNSPGQAHENLMDPQSQVYKFCELWAPARHRILGYVGGNHERRGLKGFGDLGILIATILRIPYSAGQQLIDIHYGYHEPFKVHLWHGTGASRTTGAKAMMLHRFMQTGDSQLYLVGHLHASIILHDWRTSRATNRDVHLTKIAGAMSSSFLSYWGNYSEVAGMSVSDVMMARTLLDPDGGWELTAR